MAMTQTRAAAPAQFLGYTPELDTFLARIVTRVERTNPRDTTAASHRG